MIYALSTLFWLIELTGALYYETAIYDSFVTFGFTLQLLILFTCLLVFVNKPTSRLRSTSFWMLIHHIYAQIAALFFYTINDYSYLLETSLFCVMAVWIMMRPEVKTAKTINKDNILLVFYKGEKGSFIMNFFELFGLPVKSMCIIAGDKALFLKANKETFQFGDSKKIFRKQDEYVIVDTGKPYTQEFVKTMEKHSITSAKKGLFRIRCIEGVSPLLEMIGPEFKPSLIDNIPSIYLRKVS